MVSVLLLLIISSIYLLLSILSILSILCNSCYWVDDRLYLCLASVVYILNTLYLLYEVGIYSTRMPMLMITLLMLALPTYFNIYPYLHPTPSPLSLLLL